MAILAMKQGVHKRSIFKNSRNSMPFNNRGLCNMFYNIYILLSQHHSIFLTPTYSELERRAKENRKCNETKTPNFLRKMLKTMKWGPNTS